MFQARSVVGGYWMRVFVDQFIAAGRTGIGDITPKATTSNTPEAWFDLSGRPIVNSQSSNTKLPKGIYIKDGKKTLIK